MKIGVCDVNSNEIQRTVYYLNQNLNNSTIDKEKVEFVACNLDSVMFDIDYQKFDYDIFITEILYPGGRNGVDLAKKINAVSPACKVIFYASRIPYDIDVYEAAHVSCMLKGRHEERLIKCLDRLIYDQAEEIRKKYIKIHYDRNVSVLDCRDIMYIRIENRVTKYYTIKKTEKSDGVFYEYRPLSEIMLELPNNFVRCSSAVIVNMDFIDSYNRHVVTMQDGEIIKIGRRYGERLGKMSQSGH